ncbi:MAG: DUF3810 domain-containing protein [Eubacteriales bacterium]|nr:DUF3810 domain-containing protein [Eubacteriales bacterium]
METRRKRSKTRFCPIRLTLTGLAALVILLQRALRGSYPIMRWLSAHFVRPTQRRLGELSARVSFSVAELLIVVAVVGLLLYLLFCVETVLHRGRLFRQLYRLVLTLLCFVLVVYAGFCVLWGIYFYGDDFMVQSGLQTGEISTEELRTVTSFFAVLLDETAGQVERDGTGACATDREAVLERSETLYAALERDFPCLEGPPLRAKGVKLSRLLSYIDFTGFFFPFTGEANVNMDFPPSLFAATVAHELAHQRGVAKEQEANFVAVLACLRNDDPDYTYSAALLAYSYLSSALAEADRAAWEEISAALPAPVLRDLEVNRSYWQRFETPVQEVSNTVYENFMYSYDQELGLRSYGACVDLLVHYYYGTALQYLHALQTPEGNV